MPFQSSLGWSSSPRILSEDLSIWVEQAGSCAWWPSCGFATHAWSFFSRRRTPSNSKPLTTRLLPWAWFYSLSWAGGWWMRDIGSKVLSAKSSGMMLSPRLASPALTLTFSGLPLSFVPFSTIMVANCVVAEKLAVVWFTWILGRFLG